MQNDRELLQELFYVGLRAADPYECVRRGKDHILKRLQTGRFRETVLIAFGKAACRMAESAEEILKGYNYRGWVITKYGHCQGFHSETLEVFEAAHPVPDENSVRATEAVLKGINPSADTLTVCLISGGGSALLVSPLDELNLPDKQEITDLLLRAGADIYELNRVRKHLSKVKGGRLAKRLYPSTLVSLILSDVMGDRMDIIASGPTVPDPSRYEDALSVLLKYRLMDRAPQRVVEVLQMGKEGLIPETPKPGDPVFRNVENIVVGSNKLLLKTVKEEAERRGLKAVILSEEVSGEASEAGRWLASEVKRYKGLQGGPFCLISGGETTVTVRGTGKGGRNMELALSFAIEIKGLGGVTLLSAGTDGTDGPTDAAGAVVDGQTVRRAELAGLDPLSYLRNNDSYHLFSQTGDLLITGPTGTNVMDIQIVIVR